MPLKKQLKMLNVNIYKKYLGKLKTLIQPYLNSCRIGQITQGNKNKGKK